MNKKIYLLPLLFISCHSPKQIEETSSNHFPVAQEKVKSLPAKENFYIFLMAGQSNMAGRGFVQPGDTVSSPHILTLNKDNEWVYAKEPLHYYEPQRTGLDCGLSFGKKLLDLYNDKNITIGLVPCAIGGSSIEQWLGDATYHNVTLYSNFMKKATTAAQNGTIKGMLWHQGESNAGNGYKNYKQKLQTFFEKVRTDIEVPGLKIYAGELSSFLNRKTNPFADSVNNDLRTLSRSMTNMYVIPTSDLTPKSDTIHFDSKSQRLMGERFAEKVFQNR